MATSTNLPASAPQIGAPRRFTSFRCISALMLREMATRYGRSPGGYAWSLIEPSGTILVLSLAFSLILRTPPLGTSFLLFFATGFLPFSLYMNVANPVSRAINFSRPLLVYPIVSWIDPILARFILNSITGLLVMYLLMMGLLITADAHSVLDTGPILGAVFLCLLLALSVGILNCALGGLFPVWDMIWAIITKPLFLASGVFFTYESLPPMAQDILWWNPLFHITGLMRAGFYPMYQAAYVSQLYVLFFSMIVLLLGLLLMRRHHPAILNA